MRWLRGAANALFLGPVFGAVAAAALPSARAFADNSDTPASTSTTDTSSPEKMPGQFVLRPSGDLDLTAIEDIARTRSPVVAQADAGIAIAHADRHQAGLLPNPAFDFTWGTIPLGDPNPTNLSDPIQHVPNYNFGLSYTVPIGKIGAREDSADAVIKAREAERDGALHDESLTLLAVLGKLAESTLRVDGLTALAKDAHDDLATAKVKLDAGAGIQLDVERLDVEAGRADADVARAGADRDEALATCGALVGGACEPFDSVASARAFLDRFVNRTPELPSSLSDRPDVRALDAYSEQASADRSFGKAQAIPDPTIRLGYTYDTFLASGNQEHSLSLSVSIPLPFFDHGQAMIENADARAAGIDVTKTRLVDGAKARIPLLVKHLDAQRARRVAIEGSAIPKANAVLDDIVKSETTNLLPVDQLIAAHRALSELYLDDADSYSDAFDAALELLHELPPDTKWNPVSLPDPPKEEKQ